jgi:hypothetical protein
MNSSLASHFAQKISRNTVLHIHKSTDSQHLHTGNFVSALSHPHRMNKQETQPRPASGNDYSAVSNTFNPSVQVNPTFNVTAGNTRRNSRPLKGVWLTIVVLLVLAVGGIILKNALTKGDPGREELHSPTQNAIRTN